MKIASDPTLRGDCNRAAPGFTPLFARVRDMPALDPSAA